MSSYTPINLPYFAPSHVLPAPLPTLDEVLSSNDYLRPPINFDGRKLCVVRIGEHFVAKYGQFVRCIEAENMLYVKQHTTIPVPKVYAIYTFDEKTMIIMEFIEGKTLDSSIMSPQEFDAVGEQLRDQLNQLRQIPAPDWYGSIGRRPLLDVNSGRQYGPFDNISDMIEKNFDQEFGGGGSIKKFAQIKISFQTTLESVATALGHAYPVFSHGDLHGRNILIQPNGTPCIIDYELAGFYPSYHERLNSEQLASQLNFLDEYPRELQISINALQAWANAIMEEEELGDDSGLESKL
ncbi:kinase-like domain-containing protein [Xylaria flabelliformis]|nr:kinase-like domain-containing protein [Xylaria flabelliformis]